MVRAVAYLDDVVLGQPVLLVPLLLTPSLVQHLQIDNVRRRSPGYDAILVPQPPVSTTTPSAWQTHAESADGQSRAGEWQRCSD